MNKIRKFDDYRYTVITPTDWGFDVSHPMPLGEALTQSVGTFPIVLSPPPEQGESKQLERLHKRTIKQPKTPCDVVGCSEYASFAGVTELAPFIYVHWHNLCPCCFVCWVQEFRGTK